MYIHTYIYMCVYVYTYNYISLLLSRAGTQHYSPSFMGARFARIGLLDWSIGERVTVPPLPNPAIWVGWIVIGISKLVRSSRVSLLIIRRSVLAREWSSAKYHVAFCDI